MIERFTECPVCSFEFSLNPEIEESEILVCPKCQSRLFVEKIEDSKVILGEVPLTEEDWGE